MPEAEGEQVLYFIFLYNLFLIVLYTIAATAFFISYLRLKKPVDGWISLLFAFYILDNSIIYMTEIIEDLSRNNTYFNLSNNSIKSLILFVFILCYGHIFKCLCDAGFSRLDFICLLVYIMALITVPLLPTCSFTYWLYLNLVRLPLAYTFTRAYIESRKNPALRTNHPILSIKLLYFIAIAFIAAMTLEDSIRIFVYGETSLLEARIHKRNISEDLYSIYIIAMAFWYLIARTSGLQHAPDTTGPANKPIEDFSSDLESFAKKYKMTPRETEILQMLTAGFTNQQISDKLFITLGTTKNHIHNIYQKCEVTKRSQLLRLIGESSSVSPVSPQNNPSEDA